MSTPRPIQVPIRRFSAAKRSLIAASIAALLTLGLLTAYVFAPFDGLQIAALWSLGLSFLAVWIAVLVWRIPVYAGRQLAGFAALWGVGIGLAIALVIVSRTEAAPPLWRHSVEWLALTLSLAVGAFFLRALLRVRTSPLLGRLLSLASPIGILALIVILSLTRA